MKQLTTYEQFQELFDTQSNRLLFKHSGKCSISWGACKEVEIAISNLSIENIYQLDVINTEDLKYKIADFVKIKHESPQVIIFKKGKIQSYANHSSITTGWITNELIRRNDTRK